MSDVGKHAQGDADTPAAERVCVRAAEDPVCKSPWEVWKNKRGHGGVQALDTDTMSMYGQQSWSTQKPTGFYEQVSRLLQQQRGRAWPQRVRAKDEATSLQGWGKAAWKGEQGEAETR